MPHHIAHHVRFFPARHEYGNLAFGWFQLFLGRRFVAGRMAQVLPKQNCNWDQVIASADEQRNRKRAKGVDPQCMHNQPMDKVPRREYPFAEFSRILTRSIHFPD